MSDIKGQDENARYIAELERSCRAAHRALKQLIESNKVSGAYKVFYGSGSGHETLGNIRAELAAKRPDDDIPGQPEHGRQAAGAYNSLVEELNKHTSEGIFGDTVTNVMSDEIAEPLETLRQMLAAICYTYKDGDRSFACVPADLCVFNENGE